MNSFITVNELSEKLKYSRSTIYRWISENSIPYHRLGREIRFSENDIICIINQKTAASRKEASHGYWQ